jgi:hypothetical protein
MMTLACYLVLSHIHSIHDFGSITLLFSNHMSNTDVLENNRVILLKS